MEPQYPTGSFRQNRFLFGLFLYAVLQFVVAVFVAVPSDGRSEFLLKFFRRMVVDPFQVGLMLGLPAVALTFFPHWRIRWAWIGLAGSLELWRIITQWDPAFIGLVSSAGGYSAIVGVLLLIYLLIRREQQRVQIIAASCHALTLPFLYLGSSLLMQSYVLSAPVYDMYYYVADLALGPSWGFTFTALSKTQFWFYTLGYLTYFSLSHVMAITAALWFCLRRGPNPNVLFIACALVGNLGYVVFPAVGPQSFFQHLFPFQPPPPLAPHLMEFPLPDPRTAMPSLHMLWSYAIWVGSLAFPSAVRKVAFVYFLSMPIIAFLGPHYTVDLVVALAMAPPLHWLCLRPYLKGPKATFDLYCGLCALASLAYVALMIQGYSLWSVWPWILQISTVILLLACIYLSNRLHQRSLDSYFDDKN